MHLSTKYEVNPSIDLGGVREQTDRHTDRQRTLAQYNIDSHNGLYDISVTSASCNNFASFVPKKTNTFDMKNIKFLKNWT